MNHPIYVVLFCCFLMYSMLCGIATISRQDFFPLNKRNKEMLFIGFCAYFMYGYLVLFFIEENIKKKPLCHLNLLLRGVMLIFINLIVLFRVIYIWLEHRKQLKIIRREVILLNKKLFILIFAIVYILSILYPMITHLTMSENIIESECTFVPIYENVFAIVASILYFLACTFLLVRKDNHYFKFEFYGCAFCSIAYGITYVTLVAFDKFEYSQLVGLLLVCGYMFFSFLFLNLQTLKKHEIKSKKNLNLDDMFQDTLSSKLELELFRAFLEREFSVENLDFYFAALDFKNDFDKMTNPRHKIWEIYYLYLRKNSECQVNISHKTWSIIEEELFSNQITRNILDRPAGEVYNLMKFDSYQRFINYKSSSK